MTPSPAIVGPSSNPTPGAGEAGKEAAPPKPTKEVALSVPKSEVKTIVIKTAEVQAKQVEVQQATFNTLVNTITFNVQRFNELPATDRPDFLKNFVEMFQRENPDLKDLTDQKIVAEKAEVFLKKGGGKVLLATFKLLESEAALLYGGGGVRIVEKKAPKNGSEAERPKIIYLGKDGMRTEEKQPGFWESLFSKNKDARTGKYDLEIEEVFDTGNITDPKDIAYLSKCGWTDGLDIATAENRGILIERVLSIAQTREEIFRETGLQPEDISKRLNFLDENLDFITAGRSAYLIGETGGGYTPAEFAAEGKNVIDEIKKETVDRLKKAKTEDSKKRKGAQIENKIKDLGNVEEMLPEEIKAEQAVIDQEIKKIQAEANLFTRKKILPGEIDEAQQARDEAQRLITARESGIVPVSGEVIDLIAWSEPSSVEYWGALDSRVTVLEARKAGLQAEITSLQAEITSERTQRPSADSIRRKETKKTTGSGTITTVEEPDPDLKDEFNKSRTRVEDLQKIIDEKRKKMDTDIVEGTFTLDELIDDLKSKSTRRKQVVDGDAVTKKLLEDYRIAEGLLKQRIDERTAVGTKTDALKTSAAETDQEAEIRLRKEIKKKEKQKESVGKASLDNQREVEALSLVKTVITDSEQKTAMEQRLVEQESGLYDPLEVSSEFKDYPPVVLQAVKLMFGPEALSSAGETDIYKQTKALLESKWYVKIIIEQIEAQNGAVTAAQKVDFGGSRTRGGANVEITNADLTALTPGKMISVLTEKDVNQETIGKIIEQIGSSALGFI